MNSPSSTSTDPHLRRRRRLVHVAATVVIIACFRASLAAGDLALSPFDVISAILGTADPFTTTVVMSWRLPRAILALAFGAALAVSGAIFQTLTRNPLGSPDIIGFNTGAFTGALITIMFGASSYLHTAAGALVGGLVTAFAVYALAYRRGITGFRLIVTGIALTAMLSSVNTWLIYRADGQTAARALLWGTGSLESLSWQQALPALALLLPLAGVTVALARPLHMLELGDDTASALGLRLEPTRLSALVVGVALTATVTAAAGPIAFIALAAPQIGARLAPSGGISLRTSALIGAALLAGADWIAAHAFAPTQVPVGIITVSVGGIYLLWLIIRQTRTRS